MLGATARKINRYWLKLMARLAYEVILFLNFFTIIKNFSMRRVMRRVMPASL